jgi:hypothetical protein
MKVRSSSSLSPDAQRESDEKIITRWFGEGIAGILHSALIWLENRDNVEEIRLRINQPLQVITGKNEFFLTPGGQSGLKEKAYLVTKEDLMETIERMTQSSLYAAEEQLRQGFLTLPGGHRVGITVPISVGMVVLRFPLIRVLFEHGSFKPPDTEITAIPLFYFALGITAQAIIQILPRAFYALQNTWMPVGLGLVAMAASIASMFILVGPLAHGGLALAVTIGAIVHMILLFVVLRRMLGRIDGRRIGAVLGKTLAAASLMGLVIFAWNELVGPLAGTGKIGSIIILTSGSLIGMGVFALITRTLKMAEYSMTLDMLGRRKKIG